MVDPVKAAPTGYPLMVDAQRVTLDTELPWRVETCMEMLLIELAWREDVRAIRELTVGAWIVEAVRTPAVREEMVAVEAIRVLKIAEFATRVAVERVLTVRAVGSLVAVVYHLPALPVTARVPKAVVMVLLVVPSSKVSDPLVTIVIVEAAAAPVTSFRVSVRPGIVVVRGNVIVPGRAAELRKTRLVAVDNDMSLYCCLGSFWSVFRTLCKKRVVARAAASLKT